MKKGIALLTAALTIGTSFLSCSAEEDLLTHKYNYDLSEYIELGNYKGLPAEGYEFSITDEQIEQQILSTRAYYSRSTAITDRGAENGDILIIDYVSTDAQGNELEGGSETECELYLGYGTFIDEVETACVGAYAGDHISVDGVFPESYPDYPDMAGQAVHFEIDVREVREQELPEYTEDFVRAYLGYDSIEEYESNLRVLMEEHYKDIFYEFVITQVWETVVESTNVIKYPEKELKQMYDDMVTSNEALSKAQGINFPDFIKLVFGMTEEEFYEYAQSEAEARIKEEMICYAIAREENITLTDEEYIERATEYATDIYGLASLEAFEAIYDKSTIKQTLMIEKVKEAVADYADITYLTPIKAD